VTSPRGKEEHGGKPVFFFEHSYFAHGGKPTGTSYRTHGTTYKTTAEGREGPAGMGL